MSWGAGPWGYMPWGSGITLAVPTILGVSSDPGPLASRTNPAVVDEKGGTICTLLGSGFSDPILVEVLMGSFGSYEVVGEGYVVEPRYDLQSNRVIFGAPALEGDAYYHLRVTTEGGESDVLEDCLRALPFADRLKIVSTRAKWADAWVAGARVMRS